MPKTNFEPEEIEQQINYKYNTYRKLQCTLQDDNSNLYINKSSNSDIDNHTLKHSHINLNGDTNMNSNPRITNNNHFEETLKNCTSSTRNLSHSSATSNHKEYPLGSNPSEPHNPKFQEKQPSQSRNAYFSRVSRMRRREREERLQEWNSTLEISNRELLKVNSELEDEIHSLHYTNNEIRNQIRHPLWPIESPMLKLTAPRYEIESDILKLSSKTCWLGAEVSHLQHNTQRPNPDTALPSHDAISHSVTRNHPPLP